MTEQKPAYSDSVYHIVPADGLAEAKRQYVEAYKRIEELEAETERLSGDKRELISKLRKMEQHRDAAKQAASLALTEWIRQRAQTNRWMRRAQEAHAEVRRIRGLAFKMADAGFLALYQRERLEEACREAAKVVEDAAETQDDRCAESGCMCTYPGVFPCSKYQWGTLNMIQNALNGGEGEECLTQN